MLKDREIEDDEIRFWVAFERKDNPTVHMGTIVSGKDEKDALKRANLEFGKEYNVVLMAKLKV